MYLGPLRIRSVSERFLETIACHPLNLSHLFSAVKLSVPRPTCTFHFSAAVDMVLFLTCMTQRVEGWTFCMGKDCCSSVTLKDTAI